MDIDDAYRWRRQMLRGLVLVAAGAAVLLDRTGLIDLDAYWQYAPLLLVAFGLNRAVGAPNARDLSGGLWTALTGIWLFICLNELFGLTFWNSWPVFIIIGGLTMVLRPFAARRFHLNSEEDHATR